MPFAVIANYMLPPNNPDTVDYTIRIYAFFCVTVYIHRLTNNTL